MASEQARQAGEAWRTVVSAAAAGDRVAYARLARLVTGFLGRWRAFDFQGDWEDMVQEVLVSTLAAHEEGRFEADGAVVAYVRQATRFKFVDRIRASKRATPEADPAAVADRAEGPSTGGWPPDTPIQSAALELRLSVSQALAGLEDRERSAIVEVHLRGRTYEEAAEITGIPLGSLKRALRTGLARMKEVLDAQPA